MPKQSYVTTVAGQVLVKEAFNYQGLTQKQLAEAANLRTRSSVSKLLNGKPVERQIFQRLCNCLEVDFRVVAGLKHPADISPEEQPIPPLDTEVSVATLENVRHELNELKTELQSLMDVPRLLSELSTHVEGLSASLMDEGGPNAEPEETKEVWGDIQIVQDSEPFIEGQRIVVSPSIATRLKASSQKDPLDFAEEQDVQEFLEQFEKGQIGRKRESFTTDSSHSAAPGIEKPTQTSPRRNLFSELGHYLLLGKKTRGAIAPAEDNSHSKTPLLEQARRQNTKKFRSRFSRKG